MINQIIHGDCMEVMGKLENESVDLVITDPPYKLTLGGSKTHKRKMGGIFSKSMSENVSNGKIFDHNEIDFSEWMPEVHRVLKENSHFYCFINCHHVQEVLSIANEVGFTLNNILVMFKDNTVVNQWYMKNVEYVLFFRKGDAKPLNNHSDNTCVMVRMPKEEEKIHPTQKPTKYIEMMIKNSSIENEIVLDPFGGSGSTALACMNTKRNFITCEIDKKFYLLTAKRIKDHESFLNGQLFISV